jgi:hypothetical protein
VKYEECKKRERERERVCVVQETVLAAIFPNVELTYVSERVRARVDFSAGKTPLFNQKETKE